MRRGRLGQNRSGWNAPIPRLWLLSDARRLPDPRAAALRLPRGGAVLARDMAPALLRPLAALARQRQLALVVAAEGRTALALRAGLHLPDRRPARGLLPFLLARRRRRPPLLSVAAHGRAGIARARRLRADLVLLSPVFPTASHPGAPGLGTLRWAALARRAGRPVIALGGVNARNSRRLPPAASGWAAIGGLS
ncbi:thiamine phosphate synthase [Roseomonas sp. SSH11]|uniref:Thiamine phosphate synthase n=1 Tax=Pararoseomonas baculiformis TaxID=2820812 RepID=A0ABS4ACG9_9PROT|nr:thiamine phosphate synthase [Pararoseomonas baculiformis]MBP0444707.1 thiamine phosphate synthase [Pararoseomonas baculiformis]